MTIELQHLRFFAFHGLFPGERRIGSEFEVNLSVTYDTPQHIVKELPDTINYVRLYEIVKKRMENPTDLLETIAMELAEIVKQEFDLVTGIQVFIYKLNPPIANFHGRVGVNFQKSF